MLMKGFEYLIFLILIVAFFNALLNRFREMRNDAFKQGHSSLASIIRGIAYVAMGTCSIFFTGILLYNAKSLVESISLIWTMVLTIGLIFLFFGVGWGWFSKWLFNKKSEN